MSKKANLEWIKELVQQGKTVKEIALETEYAEGTIRKHLKSLGLRANSKKAYITDEVIQEIIRLNKDGLTNKAIGEKLNMNASTVRKYLLENGLESCSERSKSISKKELILTEEQLDILYGSLLGDMSIGINWKNARPSITHGTGQEEYFDYKCSFFKGILGNVCKTPRYDKRTNKWYHKYAVRSLTNPIFTKIHNICYPNGKKTITEKWLKFLTPMGLAFWFIDDGTNSGIIATNCFSTEECELLINWFNKHNITASIHHGTNNGHVQNLIYIHTKSREHFYNLVEPYIIPEMMYKFIGWNPKVNEFREPLIKENSEPSILNKDKGATTSNS